MEPKRYGIFTEGLKSFLEETSCGSHYGTPPKISVSFCLYLLLFIYRCVSKIIVPMRIINIFIFSFHALFTSLMSADGLPLSNKPLQKMKMHQLRMCTMQLCFSILPKFALSAFYRNCEQHWFEPPFKLFCDRTYAVRCSYTSRPINLFSVRLYCLYISQCFFLYIFLSLIYYKIRISCCAF